MAGDYGRSTLGLRHSLIQCCRSCLEMSTVSVDNFVGKRRDKRDACRQRAPRLPVLKNRAPKN
jgi:hypothetical protein